MKKLPGITVLFLLLFHSVLGAESIDQRVGATNLQPNGWHLAESTGGGFSVLVPWPFVDSTFIDDSKMFSIISTSPNYTSYMAFFVPSGNIPEMFNAFNEAVKNSKANVGNYQGNPTIYETDTLVAQGMKTISHSKRIMTDSGLYLLWVIAQEQNERPNDIKRFFNSLVLAE